MKPAPLALASVLLAAAFTPALASEPAPQAAPALSSTATNAPAPTPETQPAAEPAPQERLICRKQGATGSRAPREKVCLTKSQWRAQDEASGLRDLRERSDRRR